MKSYNLFFILSIVFTLLINAGHAFDYNFGEDREGFYEIIVNYPNGKITDKKSSDYVEYVNGMVETFHDIIMNNISTYENPSKLDELQKSYEERLQKNNLVEDYIHYGYAYQALTFEDSTLFYAYLSVPLVEEVRAIPGIDYCNLPIYFEPSSDDTPKEEPKVEQQQEEPNVEQQQEEEPNVEQQQDNVVCEKKDQSEDFYTVFVHYPKGEFSEEDPEYVKYLNDLIEYVHYIIIKNKRNYQNPKKLDEIQQQYEANKSRYLKDYGNYGTVYRTIANGEQGIIMLAAYLNEKNVAEVKNLADVTSVNIPTKYYPDDENIANENEETICFEKDDTLVDEPIQEPELPKVEQKEKKLVCEPRVESEGFYIINVQYEYGEFIVEDPEFEYYLADFMNSIDNIIYKNKETYQDRDFVKELHNIFNSEYNSDSMKYENSGSVKVLYLTEEEGTIVLSAYLNSITAEEVKKLSSITSVEQDASEGHPTDEYCHEVEVDSITPEEADATEEVAAPQAAAAECFSISLGYPCCSQGATVYYVDNDGEWGYENDSWCGVSN